MANKIPLSMSRLLPPFSKEHQLCSDLDIVEDYGSTCSSQSPTYFLPGQMCIKLTNSAQLDHFLDEDFWAQDLETMAPHLWVMTTPSSTNINSLHQQIVKGREIIVTEDPRLHLVWIHNRIFIKPIPVYLLSHAFWNLLLLDKPFALGTRRKAIKQAALGFLRTYACLIRRQSDFFIAQQGNLRLIPQDVDWIKFRDFISEVSTIDDIDVSGRYHYGELRLTRLNFYAKFFLGKFHYEKVHGQYGDYFARWYGPVLFIFAIVSTILNSMQVEMAAEQVLDHPSTVLGSLSSWTSRVSLVSISLIAFVFIVLWLRMFLDEWVYTFRKKPWKRFPRLVQSQC